MTSKEKCVIVRYRKEKTGGKAGKERAMRNMVCVIEFLNRKYHEALSQDQSFVAMRPYEKMRKQKPCADR